MSTFSDTSPILIKKRKGDSTDPFKPIIKNLKIVHNTAILNEIPDNFRRVNIEGMIEKRTDFYNENNSIAENEYIVDYKLGYVFFNEKMNDKTVKAEYLGTGVVLYPASRIYDTGREDVIVTIQEMINGGREAIEAYGNIDNAIKTAEEYYAKISTCVDGVKEISDTLNITIVNGTDINDILNKTIEKAKKVNNTLNGSIIDGTNKITEIDNIIQELSICEEYNPEKEYKKLNRVSFRGSSYECIKDCKDILPNNKEYWNCIAEKGKDGKDGEGSGNMHTEKYDKDEDGIVDFADDSNKLGGKLADEYALKSEVSSNVNFKPFKNTIVLEEESNKVKIGISEFNMIIDEILVHQNGMYIERNKEYKISLDGLYIEKINGSWNKNTIFNFVMYKGLKDKIEYEDGALILNGSITLEKLNLDIQNKINSIDEKLDKSDLADSLTEKMRPFQEYMYKYPNPVIKVNNIKPNDEGTIEIQAKDIKMSTGQILENMFESVTGSDLDVRQDIMEMKLKLKEQLSLDFANKTGIGFLDTFENTDYIKEMTATGNSTDKSISFGSTDGEYVTMKPQTFDKFNEMYLFAEVGDMPKLKVKDAVTNSKNVLLTSDSITPSVGNHIFWDGETNKITNTTQIPSTIKIDYKAIVSNVDSSTNNNTQRSFVQLSNGWLIVVRYVTEPGSLNYIVSKDNGQTWETLGTLPLVLTNPQTVAIGTNIYTVYRTSSTPYNLHILRFDATQANGGNISSLASYQSKVIDTDNMFGSSFGLAPSVQGGFISFVYPAKTSSETEFSLRYRVILLSPSGSLENESSFVSLVKLKNTDSFFRSMYIAQMEDNKCCVVYSANMEDEETSTSEVDMMCITYDGNKWSSPYMIRNAFPPDNVEPTDLLYVPSQYIGEKGHTFLTYYHYDDDSGEYDILSDYVDDFGARFGLGVSLDFQHLTTKATYVKLTMDAEGNVYALWEVGSPIHLMYYSKWKYQYNNWQRSSPFNLNPENKDWRVPRILDPGHSWIESEFDSEMGGIPFVARDHSQGSGKFSLFYRGDLPGDTQSAIVLEKPITAYANDQLPLLSLNVLQGSQNMELFEIIGKSVRFKLNNLDTTTSDIKITGKNQKLDAIAYVVS
ncbi:TPA: hypothetical protein PTV74_003391 [Clostridium botulinum]|nr:hypothetical protein [Clostridium botulinum]HDK7206543.1 hypothetical protein [Clostridium botulinum]HDK7210278.1 hypothetical protein [Clostridium botulinum]HDK7265728.1 hypothetical protein [Clostridium botulinum]HDK7269575.1 hypothetical protein [Clostridium botulinum]